MRGSGRKEPITCGVSRGAVGEEEDLDPALDREKPEISRNVWERPKKNFRRPSTIPVCPESVSHDALGLQRLPRV